jgi:hypothetical protein
MVLFADIVETTGEGVSGRGVAAQTIEKRGSRINSAVLGPQTLDQVLAGLPDCSAIVFGWIPVVLQLLALEKSSNTAVG